MTAALSPSSTSVGRAWWVRFAALAVIWGMSFLLIKVALGSLVPLQVAFVRVAIGALVLLVVAMVRRDALPRSLSTWLHLGVAAFLLNTVPFALFGYAEQRIPSSIAGICNAATPLFTVAVTVLALRDERPDRRRTAGLLVGFAGVLVVLGVWSGPAPGDLVGILMVLAAALCYALGWVYLRRFVTGTPHSAVVLSAGQLLASTAQLAVVTALSTQLPGSLRLDAALAVVGLGALGTGFAYVLQYSLIRDAGVTVASTVTYFIPIVSVVAGIVALDERPHLYQLAGAAVIILGAYLSRTPRTPGG